MNHNLSIPLSAKDFDAVKRVFAAPTIASSRKSRSLSSGFRAEFEEIPVDEMFRQDAELQRSLGSGEAEDIVKNINSNAISWASLVVFAATCACHLVSCGTKCPIGRDTRAFRILAEGVRLDHENKALLIDTVKIQQAFKIWFGEFPMEMTGRMCGDKALCQGGCVFNSINKASEEVLISYFEAFLGELGYCKEVIPGAEKSMFEELYTAPEVKTGQTAAIVGAGPAGLMLAYKLAKQGIAVTVYEATGHVGGTVADGVPHDKYSKEYLGNVQKLLESMGVVFKFNTRVGTDISVEEIEATSDIRFLATGVVHKPKQPQGEFPEGTIVQAMDYLRAKNEWVNAFKAAKAENQELTQEQFEQRHPFPMNMKGKTVFVVGSGYTAYDVIRGSLRDQCADGTPESHEGKVYKVYYKGDFEEETDYPHNTSRFEDNATFKMMEHIKAQGGDVDNLFYLDIKKIETDEKNRITSITFEERICTNPHIAEVNPKDARYEVKGEKVMTFDPEVEEVVVVNAVGYDRDLADGLTDALGLERDERKGQNIKAIENFHTSRPGWFAAGDIANNKHEVVHAFRSAALGSAAAIDWLAENSRQAEQQADVQEKWNAHKKAHIQHKLNGKSDNQVKVEQALADLGLVEKATGCGCAAA